MSDEQLFEAVKKGDGAALSELYDRHVAKVYKIARRFYEDEQKIQEIVQDVFTRVWTTTSYQPIEGNFDHWLAVITRNITIDYLRKDKRRPHIPIANELFEQISGEGNTETTVGQKLLRDDLIEAISKLHKDQRVVLQLAYFMGYTLNEIAIQLKIPIGTVKTRLHIGLRSLRLVIHNLDEEEGQNGAYR